jgi:hypothetical protein
MNARDAVMPGMPGAARAAPASVSSGGAKRNGEPVAERSTSVVTKVAWLPRRRLARAEWLATGRRLGAIGRCSQWWIGDWVRYGAGRWGEKYAEAARVTGYDVASLRNMAWVASRFELSLRNDKLTWSHHVLLAPLDRREQRRWLRRAAEERLSVADLRLELRTARNRDRGHTPDDAVAREPEVVVCPRCGHELTASAD